MDFHVHAQHETGHMHRDVLKHSMHMGAWVVQGCPHGVLRGVQDGEGMRLNSNINYLNEPWSFKGTSTHIHKPRKHRGLHKEGWKQLVPHGTADQE